MPAPKTGKTATPAPAPAAAPAPEQEVEQPQETGPESLFTDEELAYAKDQLDKATPESFASVLRYLEQLEKRNYDMSERSNDFPEARVIVFTELYSMSGQRYHITQRGDTIREVLDAMSSGLKYAQEQFGFSTSQKASSKPKGAPNAPNASAGSSSQASETGTDTLNKIEVTSERVNFHVGQFKWPFGDKRDAAVIAGLFDQDLGWQAEHFDRSMPRVYNQADWGEALVVDWAREPGGNNKMYYNVKRIHRP